METYEKFLNLLSTEIARQPPEIAKEFRRILVKVSSEVLEEKKD